MLFWHIMLLILLILLLVLLIVVVLQRNWIRIVLPGFPSRERLVENLKFGLLWLVIVVVNILIWMQVDALTSLTWFDAIINGFIWGSLITLGVSITSHLRGQKRRVDFPSIGKIFTSRQYVWLFLVLILISTVIPYLGVLWNYGEIKERSQQSLDGSLEFSIPIFDSLLINRRQISVSGKYFSFPTHMTWADDDIMIHITVRDEGGVLVASTELDLNIIRDSVWFLVHLPASQMGSAILQVPVPGLYTLNLTTEFEKTVLITVVQMWQPLMDILFIIAALGGFSFIVGAVGLCRRSRVIHVS